MTLKTLLITKGCISLCFIMVFILIAIVSQSRSFLLGYSFALLVFSLVEFPKLNYRRYFVTLILAFSIFFSTIVFLFKTDSSLGRILIYKISLKILRDNYITGIGWDKFGVEYGKFQIDYFENGNYTTKELLLADNTIHAFNDYLQIFIETGVSGLLIIGLLGILIFKCCLRSLRLNKEKPVILVIAISQLIAICISALFNHTFDKLHWQCLFLLSFGIVIYHNHYVKSQYIVVFTISSLLVVSTFKFWEDIVYRKQYEIMKGAVELFQAGYIIESVKLYKQVYPKLSNDGEYLYNYAVSLMAARKYKDAETVLVSLINDKNNSINYNMLATCYYHNGKFRNAESTYYKAIFRVPNKFTSRFNLYNFYVSTNQLTKAHLTKQKILKLPVKIESVIIDRIKTALNK